MTTYNSSVVINRPIEEVFDTATCLRSCVNWQTSMVRAEKDATGPAEVGAKYNHEVKFMGLNIEAHPVIRAIEAPRRFVFGDDTTFIPYEVTYSFDPVEGGTRFTARIESGSGGPALIKGIARSVFEKPFNRQVQSDMEALKDLMEAGATVKIP